MSDDNTKDITPPRGFNARSFIYALIPIGFVLIVGGYLLLGTAEQMTEDSDPATYAPELGE